MTNAIAAEDKLDAYRKSSYGRELLKKYEEDTEGIWIVDAADNGMGSNRTIGNYEGKLIDVLRYVVGQPQFWSWDHPGYIRKLETTIINEEIISKQKEYIERRKELELELASLNQRIL